MRPTTGCAASAGNLRRMFSLERMRLENGLRVVLAPDRHATAVAVALGAAHTCARLDGGSVRCWGYGGNGRLGLCGERTIGDDEPPSRTAPVWLGGEASAVRALRRHFVSLGVSKKDIEFSGYWWRTLTQDDLAALEQVRGA